MPVSKRRKPKKHLAPNAMPANQAKAHFRQLAQMDGKTFSLDARTLAPLDAEATAFANAWTYAYEHNVGYAEGVVWTDNTGWIAHAWCVTTTDAIIETTPGFDTATTYKGWVLERKDAEMMNGGLDTPTRSVLETGLAAGGGQWTALAGRITKREATPTNGPKTKAKV